MTNPAMHRCLQVLDTQQLICEAILSGSEPHASLAALAMTCKQLCEPALVALWSEMDDVLPLLRLLPEDLFHLVQVCATGGTRKGASGERMHYHYTSAGSFQAPPVSSTLTGITHTNAPYSHVFSSTVIPDLSRREGQGLAALGLVCATR